jgi:hypothetical protein
MSGNSIRKLRFGSFEEFKEDFIGLIESNVTGLEDGLIEDLLIKADAKFKHLYPLIEPFTGLQVCIQRVIETLVLMDYQLYLQEKDINVELITIFDEETSPRCVALIANKRN